MTAGDEGDEHQMERRLQWEANAYKGQCNEQRGPKATLPELASMKKTPDCPQTDLECPTRA